MARTSVAHILVAVVIAVAACSRGDGAGEATTETTADVPRAEVAFVTHRRLATHSGTSPADRAEAGTR